MAVLKTDVQAGNSVAPPVPDNRPVHKLMETGLLFKKGPLKIGVLLALVFAIGAGPLVHDHKQNLSETERPIHHEGHSHDDDQAFEDADLVGTKIAFSGMAHTHLPSSFDHIHDTWLYQAGLIARPPNSYSLHFVGSHTSIRQAADLQIEKPPKPLPKV